MRHHNFSLRGKPNVKRNTETILSTTIQGRRENNAEVTSPIKEEIDGKNFA